MEKSFVELSPATLSGSPERNSYYSAKPEDYLVVSLITVASWWARWSLKSAASRLFTQSFVQAQMKENNKPLGGRRIPRTKVQSRGKCFHFMTSSWLLWFYFSLWRAQIIHEMGAHVISFLYGSLCDIFFCLNRQVSLHMCVSVFILE